MHDIQAQVEQWLAENQQVILATVIKTWGSAPRKVGAKMAINQDLAMIGSVSGGCIESAVINEAEHLFESRQAKRLHFGVADETAWDVGLACGGEIDILLEPLDVEWWQLVSEKISQKQSIITATISDERLMGQRIVFNATDILLQTSDFPAIIGESLFSQKAELLRLNASISKTVQDTEWLIDIHHPKPELIIVGGAHVAMTLQEFAVKLGFDIYLIDPRRTFATNDRFPQVQKIYHQYPQTALNEIGLHSQSYLAVLTHDPKIDDPALITALEYDLPYVGVMSSRKSHRKRIERLLNADVSQEKIDTIHAPIGIDIHSQTPEEIALAIMAEIVSIRNKS